MNKLCEVSYNETFIRYLTASRFIKQGELILKEKPLMVDFYSGSKYFCLKCCTNIKTDTFEICKKCNVAILCERDCSGEFHSDGECDELSKLNLNPNFLLKNPEVITVLRLILKRKYSEYEWEEINQLESHLGERRNTPVWKSCEALIEKVMKEAGILSELDEKKEIVQNLCGILDVNSFEIRQPYDQSDMVYQHKQQILRGLYPKAAFMAHDCMGNTHLAVDDDFSLYIRASVDIEKGFPIFFNYANVLDGNVERNKSLRQGKYFECTCKRCMDPTEFNTNISSLKCHNCKEGLIQPQKNLENKFSWTCTSCKKNYHNCLIETTLRLARNLISDAGPGDLLELEKVNLKLLRTLHPHHNLILELQQILMGLYTQDVHSKNNFLKKIDCCRNIIAVTQILEPGISRIQGITLYELHAAQANLAFEEYSKNEITTTKLLDRLISAEETLKTALKHLLYEPKRSPEGCLAQNALGYLKKLRESINNMETNFEKQSKIKK